MWRLLVLPFLAASESCEECSALLQVHQAAVDDSGDDAAPPKMPKCVNDIDGHIGLIVVDMQNDFVNPDGSLPVHGAEEIIPTINKLISGVDWDLISFTEDYHPMDHISFAVNSPLKKEPFDFVTLTYASDLKICGTEYEKVYPPMAAGDCSEKEIVASFEQELWPKHCIQNTYGQQFHEDLEIPRDAVIVKKGFDSTADSYGALYNNIGNHLDDHLSPDILLQIRTSLFDALRVGEIYQVFITGVAEDYCVKYTAMQALQEGYVVYLITDATKPVDEEQGQAAEEELVSMGVKLITSCEVLGTCECSSVESD